MQSVPFCRPGSVILLLWLWMVPALAYTDARGEEREKPKGEPFLAEQTMVIATATLQPLTTILNTIEDQKIVYVGEVHDNFAHHAVQLAVIKSLYAREKKLAIGMEMFQRPFQPAIDAYIAGAISEREFLQQTEYFSRWGFDFRLYKPILDFAHAERIPVVALNVRKEIVKKISNQGLESLSEAERAELPAEMDFSDNTYRERLYQVYQRHREFQEEEKPFTHFYQSQIAWDESMAQAIADFLAQHPDYQMVVLAGNGHLVYGSGIPQRVFRRTGYPYVVILNEAEVAQDVADYIVFPQPMESPSSPKLMVFLREEEGRVMITGFPQESVSQKAGLAVGDVILALDNVPIRTIADVRLDLLYRQKGDTVTVRVLREETEMEFQVSL
ncbi:MAG: PDZ domain-containing protein [Nitrospinota bacterium]|nr:MAG: PDZ domain-containing protein [Nitrospinota bacterium]